MQVQRTVGPGIVVIVFPVSEDDPGFAEGEDEFAVQAFLPESTIKALHVAILPWAPRIDVECFDFVILQPLLYGIGNKLGSVVRADVLRGTVLFDSFLQDRENITGLDRTVGMDAVTLASVLINQVEGTQLAAALGIVADVPSPKGDMTTRAQSQAQT